MGAYTQTYGSSTPVSTGGKGTSTPQYPGYTNYGQSPWLGLLAAALQKPQQPVYQYQAPTYGQMRQQALPQGWQPPPPVYTPPATPTPAPAPAAMEPSPVQPQIYDPGFYAAGRASGGRIEEVDRRKMDDHVNRAIALIRRNQ